ncbi:hypothetical protein PHISP_04899 [Aspergillus sp. HF37]|nr:hypothetical protein PHISP_04899 [Aspergillus sp. HF37]
MSMLEVLLVTREVFSNLPKDENWLPFYIKSRLQRSLVSDNSRVNIDELYSGIEGDSFFQSAIMKMVVEILFARLHLMENIFSVEENHHGSVILEATTDDISARGHLGTLCSTKRPCTEEVAAAADYAVPDDAFPEEAAPEETAPEEAVADYAAPETLLKIMRLPKRLLPKRLLPERLLRKRLLQKRLLQKTRLQKTRLQKTLLRKTLLQKTLLQKTLFPERLLQKTLLQKRLLPMRPPRQITLLKAAWLRPC